MITCHITELLLTHPAQYSPLMLQNVIFFIEVIKVRRCVFIAPFDGQCLILFNGFIKIRNHLSIQPQRLERRLVEIAEEDRIDHFQDIGIDFQKLTFVFDGDEGALAAVVHCHLKRFRSP